MRYHGSFWLGNVLPPGMDKGLILNVDKTLPHSFSVSQVF